MHQQQALDQMTASGLPPQTALATLNSLVEQQSMMLATLDMFHAIAVAFFLAAFAMLYVVGGSLPKTDFLTKIDQVRSSGK